MTVFRQHLSFLSFLKGIFFPLLLWLLFTPLSPWIDKKIAYYFYNESSFQTNSLWNAVYFYGIWPAWVAIFFATLALIYSFFSVNKRLLKPALFLLLTLAVGSGLIIHGILKDHWGRPRPKQVIEFGGHQPFRPYYDNNIGHQPEPSKSFPSGHASMGFYFFTFILLGNFYKSRWLYWTGMILSWGLGILLSLTRIAQGGHFFSDTLASALIMWLTAWTFYYILFGSMEDHEGFDKTTV